MGCILDKCRSDHSDGGIKIKYNNSTATTDPVNQLQHRGSLPEPLYEINRNFEDDNSEVKNLSEVKIKIASFVRQRSGNPSEYYDKISELGEGAYGIVYKVSNKITSDIRAMKIIKKDKLLDGIHIEEIEEEIRILKNLDHPNIIKIYEFFVDEVNFYIVTELCNEGHLLDKIEKMVFMNESIVKLLMFQIFSAVAYLHSQNVIHGDLKLENIMIDSVSLVKSRNSFRKSARMDMENLTKTNKFVNLNNFELKLIDFGCSKIFSRDKKNFNDLVGTIYYAAPEVLRNNYNEKCDLWSCGIIMYMLLCGRPPFDAETDEEIGEKIIKGNYNFDFPEFKRVSQTAKDLITALLTYDPTKRPFAKKVLNHAFFKESINGVNVFDEDVDSTNVLKNLRDFKITQKFNQAVLTFLTHNFAKKDEIGKLTKIFKVLDKNGDGRISRDELRESYKEVGMLISEEEIIELLKTLDGDGNGYIEYEEFIRATIDKKKLFTEVNLKLAFELFDLDKNGTICCDEIRKIIGKNLNDKVMSELLEEINKKNTEEISFEEFKKLIKSSVIEEV